jgi:hypothetical protein
MTEQQRKQRAAFFISDHPGLWLFMLYAMAFLGCAVAIDGLQMVDLSASSHLQRYLPPLAIVLPMWIGLWGWARRIASGPQGGSQI